MAAYILSPELIFSARLADIFTRRQLDLNQPVDWSSVMAILVKNKIPLLPLARDPLLSNCPLLSRPDFQQLVRIEEDTWKSLRHEYALVRDGFLSRGISNILFKSAGLEPSFPYTSDNLDVLVRPSHIEAARNVLNDLGYVELRHIEEPKKFLFRKFLAGESVSAIHLHGLVGWGAPFMDEEALWQGCRPSTDDPLVIVPSSEDAVLITIAHSFYENKSFKLLDLVRIRYCFSQRNLDFPYMQRVSIDRGWEDGFAFSLIIYSRLEKAIYSEGLIPDDALALANQTIEKSYWLKKAIERTMSRDDLLFPFKVSFLLGKLFYYRKLLTYPKRDLRTRIHSVVATLAAGIKLKLGIRGQRGMLISLSGIDGSGKSSATQVLLKAFVTSDILAYPCWIRFGSVEWLRKSSQISNNNQREVSLSNASSALERRQSKLKNPFLRMGWLLLNLAHLTLFYNLKVRVSTWFGYVVICDRYIYDALVEIEASLPNSSSLIRLSEWLLMHLCPKPQLAWLFDLPPGEALSRHKDERSSSSAQKELAFQRERYLTLQKLYQLLLVNNQGDKNEVTDMVVLVTLRMYFRDYHTWINGLLFSNPNQMNPV